MATDTGREFDGDELRSGLGLDDPGGSSADSPASSGSWSCGT